MSDLLFFAMALICTANIDWKIKPTWNYACKWESSNIFFSTGTSSLSGSIMIPCTLFISSYFFFYIRSFSTVQRTTKNSLLKIITSIVRFQQLTGHSGSFLLPSELITFLIQAILTFICHSSHFRFLCRVNSLRISL